MRLKLIIYTAYEDLISIILPRRRSEEIVHTLSLDALHEIARRYGAAVYAPSIRSLLPYRHSTIKALVYELKYRRNPHALALAATLVREEIMGTAEDSIGTPLIIPVPMHADRRRARGFNQTELLCTESVRKLRGVAYAPHALVRISKGLPQQKLPRKLRLTNMKNAMQAHPLVQGRICIVIDDVSTTGATLLECQRALKKAGAKEVHLLALAG